MAMSANRSGIAAVIVAAGAGSRFGQPKHTANLGDRPLWRWSVDVFHEAGISEVVVVGDVPGGVQGGARRRDSVLAGLLALTSDPVWVLVHDAARPLASIDLVMSVIESAERTDADGVVPGLPVTDTIKRISGDRIIETVDRADLIAVQTPQAFKKDVLLRAHSASDDDATDDAALIERIGGSVVFVAGEPDNVKITYADDLELAARILRGREE
ncbi:MAG: 2-C-methyl-D-erythritol 4-phosphate cytidylyltransferase [Actinomycetia bacterium]|nr:2-C-methyl-D-erythritol 4-phosphate cytidylyltransferase [Actinomycetes bacterium]